MLNNVDDYEDAGVTPKSPKMSRSKRKLSDDDYRDEEITVPKKICKPDASLSNLIIYF
jgi:hypothetical protein